MTAAPTHLRNADLDLLASTLRERNARKHDVVVAASSIHAVPSEAHGFLLYIDGAEPIGVTPDGEILSDFLRVVPGDVMDDGLASVLNIPRAYYRRMRTEHVPLLCENVNAWLERQNTNHLVRTFRSDEPVGRAFAYGRAFLSDRFSAIDDFDILLGVLDGVRSAAPDAVVSGADLTEKHMRVRIEAPSISLNVQDLVSDYIVGGRRGRDLPLMWAGIEVTNSEVGAGAYSLSPRAVLEVCTNGMTRAVDAIRRVHLGARMDEGVIQWSDDTRRAQVDLIRNQARDAVATFLNVDYLGKFREDMERAAGKEVTNIRHAVEHIQTALSYTADEADAILSHFTTGGDHSALGLAQAITLHAQVLDSDQRAEAEANAMVVALAAASA